MKLTKLKICNYRCFGEKEQVIKIDDITTFIGNNNSGKTSALSALNCLFSLNNNDRILKRSDFHLPKHTKPEELDTKNLYIEAVFIFDELDNEIDKGKYTIPIFFRELVVDGQDELPYIRIRLEAKWEKSNNIDGAIESNIYYIKCSENEEIKDEYKIKASRKDLDNIRVIYVPAIRDPAKQLKNVSGTMMYQIMNNINWSDNTKSKIETQINNLNKTFLEEEGVSQLKTSLNTQWENYDYDNRYSNANIQFNNKHIENSLKNLEVVFSPTVTGKDYTIDDMGDGLRSLFYVSLVNTILDVEIKIKEDEENSSFNYTPPILTIVALEEPENHISPHLIGSLLSNLNNISEKNNAQIIITSHSSSIVKRIEPENIRYFRSDIDNLATNIKNITLPNEEKLSSRYKYVKEAIKSYPELYFAKLVILGEGDSEEIILSKLVSGNPDINGISIVPLGGRHVNHFWRLLNDLDIPYITLLDLDRERRRWLGAY